MPRACTSFRLSLLLSSVTVCALLCAHLVGLLPDQTAATVSRRAAVVEAVAVHAALAAQRNDYAAIQKSLSALASRNREVVSAALRRKSGKLVAQTGDHHRHWRPVRRSTATHMFVPLRVANQPWGTVQVCFAPVGHAGSAMSLILLAAFVAALTFVGNFLCLYRVLHHLNPSKVIPPRVQTTVDSLAEGLLVLDNERRIVLANTSFARTVGRCQTELLGRRASELPWQVEDRTTTDYPWDRALRDGTVQEEHVIRLSNTQSGQRIFQVNSAPILANSGTQRGALASFNDITALEVRHEQLRDTLDRLKRSRERISEQNEELKKLATRDPLTNCLNRRAFYSELEVQCLAAARTRGPLCYLILDIDHFKEVNDRHGHAIGDQVLREVAERVQTTLPPRAVTCRYGGEEFSVLLPNTDRQQAVELGEQLRRCVAHDPISDLQVTISVGVADFGGRQGLEPLEEADRALYLAKRRGRNRVVCWDGRAADSELADVGGSALHMVSQEIPYAAVRVLMSALDYRDPATAEHSYRVADLCLTLAEGLMNDEQRYVLEAAALVHDIGKLGVPESILHKPTPLTPDERKVLSTHARIGTRILETAFANRELVNIVKMRTAWYGGRQSDSLPRGTDIPLGARILLIADAFDSMVSSRSYRTALSEPEALSELERCAGRHFDPELVTRFIRLRNERGHQRTAQVASAVALRIGHQTEKLACALDTEDRASLTEMAAALHVLVSGLNLESLSRSAQRVHALVAEEAEWEEVVQACAELMQLSRDAQHATCRASVPATD